MGRLKILIIVLFSLFSLITMAAVTDPPPEVMAFAGKWVGEISDGIGSQPHTVIIKVISKNEAEVTAIFGQHKNWPQAGEPETWIKKGKIKKRFMSKSLQLKVKTPHGNSIIYTVKNNKQELSVSAKIRGMSAGAPKIGGILKKAKD